MDKHDYAVIIRVAENWDKGRTTGLREAMRVADLSTTSAMATRLGLSARWTGKYRKVTPLSEGWLTRVPSGEVGDAGPRTGCLTIGPRFGGLLRNRATGAVSLLERIG